jgi:hypothetical protein
MKANVREDISSISKMLYNRVTSPYKQHAIIKFTGDTGLGKSYALLGCLEKVSFMMVDKFGGDAEDYFNIDNVAIITPEEVRRVAKRFKKHGIYDLDDIGVAANARRAMSDDNILLNDIVSTFRPNENILGMTVPKKRMIDVVQRELAHYNIEMSDPFFEKGFSTGTLYIPQESDYGIINTYPIWNGKIYMRHVFSLPSKKLIAEYDERRDRIAKELETDNVSMYGLKSETKKMKAIADAQKYGIVCDVPQSIKNRNQNEIKAIEKKNGDDDIGDIDLSGIMKPKRRVVKSYS